MAPEGATIKGFAIGPNLGLLWPLELTTESLVAWCARKGSRMSLATGPDVQNRIILLRVAELAEIGQV